MLLFSSNAFLKATGLATLREDIRVACNNITFTQERVEEHEDILAEKKKHVDELKKIRDRMEQLDTMEQQVLLCQGKLSWMEHQSAVEEVEKAEQIVSSKTQLVAKAKRELEEKSTGGSDYEEQLKEIEVQINEIEDSMKSIGDEIAKFAQQERDVSRAGTTAKSRLDQHRRTLKEYEERHKKVTEEVFYSLSLARFYFILNFIDTRNSTASIRKCSI
jgi:chromosome segregation ATPase